MAQTALNVTGLMDKLWPLCGKSKTIDTAEANNFNNALQQALNMLDLAADWLYAFDTKTFATTASTAEYDLATKTGMEDIHRAYSIYKPSPFVRLRPVDREIYVSQLVPRGDNGESLYYWKTGTTKISLWPTPKSQIAYTVQFSKLHGDVSNTNTPIMVPRRYEMVVLHLAKQCYKGLIESLDKMLAADPYVMNMYEMMKRCETLDDAAYETISAFPGGVSDVELKYTLNLE